MDYTDDTDFRTASRSDVQQRRFSGFASLVCEAVAYFELRLICDHWSG